MNQYQTRIIKRHNPFLLKNRIRYYRSLNKLTQTQLADICGFSKNTISALERGEWCPTAYSALILCSALSCSFDDLFYLG